jgi:hypothetical protein
VCCVCLCGVAVLLCCCGTISIHISHWCAEEDQKTTAAVAAAEKILNEAREKNKIARTNCAKAFKVCRDSVTHPSCRMCPI